MLISSQDWPGTPYDAGRTRLGPSQYIASQQSRDSSTTVSINLPLIPSILRHRRTKGAIWCRCRSTRDNPNGHTMSHSARSATSASRVRREKAALSSGCEPHPATAPAGSNRSSHGGNEMAEAFGVAGHV